MKRKLVLRPIAREELEQAVAWYESQQTDLGRQFRGEIYSCVSRIEADPEHYPKHHEKVRRFVMRRFPYLIYYLVEKRRLVILAIFHAKRNPATLRSRF